MTELAVDLEAVRDALSGMHDYLMVLESTADAYQRNCMTSAQRLISDAIAELETAGADCPKPDICICGHAKAKDHYPAPTKGTLPCEIPGCGCKDFQSQTRGEHK